MNITKERMFQLFVTPQISQPQPEENNFKETLKNLGDDATVCLLRVVTNFMISSGVFASSNLFEGRTKNLLQAAAIIYGTNMILLNSMDFVRRAQMRLLDQHRIK